MDALRWIAAAYPPSSLPPPKPKRAKAGRTREEVTDDADRLLDLLLANRLKQEDYDRRYARLVDEWESIEQAMNEEDGEEGVRHGIHSLSTMSENPTVPELRLILRSIAARIEYPVAIEGQKKSRTGADRNGLRIVFRHTLPGGVTGIVVGVYRPIYTGERFMEWERTK